MRVLRRLSLAACFLGGAFAGDTAHADPKFRVIYTFTGKADGRIARVMLLDGVGNIVGATGLGGAHGWGTAFRLTRQGALSTFLDGGGTDGPREMDTLTPTGDGAFFGTSAAGGKYGYWNGNWHCGDVFRLTPEGDVKKLYDMKCGGAKGYDPGWSLAVRPQGEIFGTAFLDAPNSSSPPGGLIFKIPRSGGQEHVVHTFSPSEGIPESGLIMDRDANIYGEAGTVGNVPTSLVYKIDRATNAYTVLATFGDYAGNGLIFDEAGSLYGTTYSSIFEISPTGATTTLYSFPHYGNYGFTDSPDGQIVRDQSGNIFGTTFFGLGGVGCDCGTVYELTKSGVKKTLHVFSGGNDGEYPDGLTIDKSGRLFGAVAGGAYGAGVVYELTP